MKYLVIGNIIALIGSVLLICTGLLSKKKHIVFVQSIQILCFVISNLVLKGFSGVVINSLSFFRNIFAYKEKLTNPIKICFIVVAAFLCIIFNNKGIIGFLPLISMCLYTWFMTTKDIIKFKYLMITITLLWGIYDFYIMSYTSALVDFITVGCNLISFAYTKNEKTKVNK